MLVVHRRFNVDMRMRGEHREWLPEWDAALTQVYQTYRRGALKALAIDLGIPANTLSKRAKDIGLPPIYMPNHPRRPWTDAEDQALIRYGDLPESQVQAKLDSVGINRAITSIRNRRRLLKERGIPIGMARAELTVAEVAQALGCKESTLCGWIRFGWLPAQAMSQNPKAKRYRITRADLRQFCRTHAAALQRCCRPDLIWYTDLIANP